MSFIGGLVDDGKGPLVDAAGIRLKRADMTDEERQEDNRRRKARERAKNEKMAAAGIPVSRPVKPVRARSESTLPLLENNDGAGFLSDETGVRIPRAEMTPEQKREDNKRRKLRANIKQQAQAKAGAEEDAALVGALLGEGEEEPDLTFPEDDGAGFLRDETGQRISRAEMTPEQRHEDNRRRKQRARMKEQAEQGELDSTSGALLTPDERTVAELLKDVPAGDLEPDDLDLLKRYNLEKKSKGAKTANAKGAMHSMGGKAASGKGAAVARNAAAMRGKGATGKLNAASISGKGATGARLAASASGVKGGKVRAWQPGVPVKGACGKGKALAGGKGYSQTQLQQLHNLLSSMGAY